LGNSINAETLAQLPMAVEFSSLIRLMPGVQVTSDSVRGPSAGASGQDNNIKLDGASLSNPLFGILQSSPSTHDIAHVSVERGGARAVGFNRSAGVTLNTESKSGTDKWTGDITYRLQKGSWQADDEDGLSTEDDIGFITAGIGGPISSYFSMVLTIHETIRKKAAQTHVANCLISQISVKSSLGNLLGPQQLTF
jgi:hypothetical protein